MSADVDPCPGQDCGATFSAEAAWNLERCPECGTVVHPCPVCATVVDAIDVFDYGDCPACATHVDVLRRVARSEVAREALVPLYVDRPDGPFVVPEETEAEA